MEKKSKNHLMENYRLHIRIVLTSLGLWPFQSHASMIFFRYFWIFQHLSIMVPEAIKLCENHNDINTVIESCSPFLYNIAVGVKFCNGIINQKKIESALSKISKDWNNLRNQAEIDVLSEFCESGKIVSFMYMVMVYSVLIPFMLFPLSPVILDIINPLNETRPKEPLYMVELYIDQDKYYFTVLLHAYVTSLAGIISLFGSDFFLFYCVHHACGMLTILGLHIKDALREKFSKEKSTDDEYGKMVDCVEQHKSVIEFCNDINGIYATSFFILMTFCMIAMSITGVVAVIKLDEKSKDFIRFAMFTIAHMFHLFCYNVMGQKLINHGEELAKTIYTSYWYESSVNTKFIVNFMILRTSKPNIIQAKIFPLHLENFTSVMKSSMSFFTVLKSSR